MDDTPTAQIDHSESGNVGEARAHFRRGVQYYEDGDYASALLEFERAYAIQRAYQLLYNLGQVSAELRDYAGAERYFRRYLKEGANAIQSERRSEILTELARLRTRVGSLRIETNLPGAEIRVDDRVIKQNPNWPIRVSAGPRELVAEKQGYAPIRRSLDVLGGEETTVSLEFGPPLTGSQRDAQSSTNVVPWITGIGSLAVLLGAGAVGYLAYKDSSDYKDELNRMTSRDKLDELSSRVKTKSLVADILLGTAIAGGIATVILLVTDGPAEASPTAAKPRQSLTLGASGVELQF